MEDSEELPIIDEVNDNYNAIDQSGSRDGEPNRRDQNPSPFKLLVELSVLLLSYISVGMSNTIGATLIDLRQIASMTVADSGGIFVTQGIGILIGSIIAKPVLQRFRYEMVLAISLGIQALCSGLIPVFRNMIIMFLMFAGQGLAVGVTGIGVWYGCIVLGGKKRGPMYLQIVSAGSSIVAVVVPFLIKPFLSSLARKVNEEHGLAPFSKGRITEIQKQKNLTSPPDILVNTTLSTEMDEASTTTHVQYYFLIMAAMTCLPAVAYLFMYIKREPSKEEASKDARNESLAFTFPLALAMASSFLQCIIYFGTQETYSNLLMTFAVLGPLKLSKTTGVNLTSMFWASMLFARLNGIWVSRFVSPFKMLLADSVIGASAGLFLMIFAGKHVVVLWVFTAVLGIALGTMTGSTVAWASKHLPANNYILSMVMIGRCAGQMGVPLAVTSLYDQFGAMTLMYEVFIMMLLFIIVLLAGRFIVIKFGTDGKLHGKEKKVENNDEDCESSF